MEQSWINESTEIGLLKPCLPVMVMTTSQIGKWFPLKVFIEITILK